MEVRYVTIKNQLNNYDLKTIIMKYKVHKFEINMEYDQARLEQFLNSLKGEVVSVVPNVKKTTLAQIYGVSRKIDFLLIVEKIL